MLDDDPIARKLIATALGQTIDQTVREHIAGITQEAPLTARIGEALQRTLDGQPILARRVTVVTQDIPDRGRHALEKAIGADLYVGIAVDDDKQPRQTKGFLVQAKLEHKLGAGPAAFEAVRGDCENMLGRSQASYIWVYGQSGVRVLNASEVASPGYRRLGDVPRRRATTVFARTLECSEGSVALGLPMHTGSKIELRDALGTMLEQLRIERGVGVLVN